MPDLVMNNSDTTLELTKDTDKKMLRLTITDGSDNTKVCYSLNRIDAVLLLNQLLLEKDSLTFKW